MNCLTQSRLLLVSYNKGSQLSPSPAPLFLTVRNPEAHTSHTNLFESVLGEQFHRSGWVRAPGIFGEQLPLKEIRNNPN